MENEVGKTSQFNVGLQYNFAMLNSLTSIDRAFGEGKIDKVMANLRTLFRQASPKLTTKERAKFITEFSKLKIFNQEESRLMILFSKCNPYDLGRDKIKQDIMINKNRRFEHLENLDILMRGFLETHKLLVPNARDMTKFENIE